MKKSSKIILNNFIWNTIGTGLASFNSLFFLIAITRINGIEDAGIFTITFATASLLYIFAIYSGRSFHTTDVKKEINDKEYIVSRIITSISMIFILAIFVALNSYMKYKNIILILLTLWRGIEAFADVFYGILQKNDALDKVGKSLIIKSILGLIAFILVDYITKNLIYACSSLCVISILTIMFYDIPNAKKNINSNEKVNKKNVIKIYKKEFFIFANTFLIMYLFNAPKYAIEKYLTEDVQAVFGIILMPASILPLFAQFLVAPVITKMTNLYKENKNADMIKIEKKMISGTFLFGIMAVILGYLIGIPILNFIYNVNLNENKIQFVIILISYILYAMGYIKSITLTIYRNMKEQTAIYLITSIVMCVCSYILVYRHGVTGAALTYLVGMTLQYILFAVIRNIKYKGKAVEYGAESINNNSGL